MNVTPARLWSLAKLTAMLQAPYAKLAELIDRAEISPTLTLNDVAYYDEPAADRLRELLAPQDVAPVAERRERVPTIHRLQLRTMVNAGVLAELGAVEARLLLACMGQAAAGGRVRVSVADFGAMIGVDNRQRVRRAMRHLEALALVARETRGGDGPSDVAVRRLETAPPSETTAAEPHERPALNPDARYRLDDKGAFRLVPAVATERQADPPDAPN